MIKRKWSRRVQLFVIIYCLVGSGIYVFQDYILLHPVKLARDYQYKFNIPFKELNIAYDDSTNINIIQFLQPDSVAKGIVLYFHGNRTNISMYERFAPYFTKSGYEVWMIDYPGFGKSTGEFSEKLVNESALQLYKLARTRLPANKIIIYGKSLGTGVASHLASIRNCRYLMLETPYYSLPDAAGFYLPVFPTSRIIKYKFPNFENLPKVVDPIIMFHGTSDWTVRYSNSEKLKTLLKPGDKLITIPGGNHLNLFDFPVVAKTIDSLLAILP